MNFTTKPIRTFNKRESYDSITTTWPDMTCIWSMIIGAILIALFSFQLLGEPEELPSIIPTVEAHEEEPYIDTVQEDALEFITKFEWLHTTAYWDIKRYSIGCGTYSYEGEVITIEEAKYRCRKRIDTKRRHYNTYKYDDNVEIALLSFEHNLWKMPYNYKWYIANWYTNALWNQMRRYTYAWGKSLRWLEIRRSKEAELLTMN